MAPFKSEAQRGWMHANHPAMAKRWEKETPKGKLPEHVSEKSESHRRGHETRRQKKSGLPYPSHS
jgi:hypothetical protein